MSDDMKTVGDLRRFLERYPELPDGAELHVLFKAHERRGRCDQCVSPSPLARPRRWGQVSGGVIAVRDGSAAAALVVERQERPEDEHPDEEQNDA